MTVVAARAGIWAVTGTLLVIGAIAVIAAPVAGAIVGATIGSYRYTVMTIQEVRSWL